MNVVELTVQTRLDGPPDMPALGLVSPIDGEYCVYVLLCGEVYYVGIDFWVDACERIRTHFRGEGADFLKRNRPTTVCMYMRVVSRGAEANVYHALLDSKPGTLIGGWTQTSWNPVLLCAS